MEASTVKTYPPIYPVIDDRSRLHPLYTALPDPNKWKYSANRLRRWALYIPGVSIAHKFIKARSLDDTPTTIELSFRASSIPLRFTHAILRSISSLGITSLAIAISSLVFATIFLTIEFGIEVYRIIRVIHFYHQINKGDPLLPESVPLSERQLSLLRRHYFDKEFLTAKESIIEQRALARYIRPWMVKRIHDTLKEPRDLIADREIIDLLKQQLKKTCIVHIISITAIATAVIGFFGLLFSPAMPILIPLIIGYTGSIIEFARYLAPDSFLNQVGYQWNWQVQIDKLKECLPDLPPPYNFHFSKSIA